MYRGMGCRARKFNQLFNLHVLIAIEKSMYVSVFGCTQVASISVISMVHSGYRFVPMFVHSGLLIWGFCKVKKIQKSEKNSDVGGWVEPQLGFRFFGEMLCF